MSDPKTPTVAQRCDAALNRLAKWRTLLTGWQLGTRAKGDPECDAVRDAAEARLLHRAELTALTRLMIEKGVFTVGEFQAVLAEEADLLSKVYEKRFPGVKATDVGLTMDLAEIQAKGTMQGWLP